MHDDAGSNVHPSMRIDPLDLLIERLSLRSRLSETGLQALKSLPYLITSVPAKRDFVKPGQASEFLHLVLDGTAARYELLRNGRRSIVELFIRGEICDLPCIVAARADWGFNALTASLVAQIRLTAIRDTITTLPELAIPFWRDATAYANIIAKAVVNNNSKSAIARLAYLLCEMGARSELAGLGKRSHYPLEVTQEQMGEMLGLTAVHTNRMLAELRKRSLASFASRSVHIADWSELAALAEFDEQSLLLTSNAGSTGNQRVADGVVTEPARQL